MSVFEFEPLTSVAPRNEWEGKVFHDSELWKLDDIVHDLQFGIHKWEEAATFLTSQEHGGLVGFILAHKGINEKTVSHFSHEIVKTALLRNEHSPDRALIAASLAQVASVHSLHGFYTHDEFPSLDVAPQRAFLFNQEIHQDLASQIVLSGEERFLPLWQCLMDGLKDYNTEHSSVIGGTVLADILSELFRNRETGVQQIQHILPSLVNTEATDREAAQYGVVIFTDRVREYREWLISRSGMDSDGIWLQQYDEKYKQIHEVFDMALSFALSQDDPNDAYKLALWILSMQRTITPLQHADIWDRTNEEPNQFLSVMSHEFTWHAHRIQSDPAHIQAIRCIASVLADIPLETDIAPHMKFIHALATYDNPDVRYETWKSLAILDGTRFQWGGSYIQSELESIYTAITRGDDLIIFFDNAKFMNIGTAIKLFGKALPLDSTSFRDEFDKIGDCLVDAVRYWKEQREYFGATDVSDARGEVQLLIDLFQRELGPMNYGRIHTLLS